MTINPLPSSVSQLLRSSVVITTPADLVKELLENSIDAAATSVEITIAADTISDIRVKDNGVGISLDDIEALGRRAHTSKLGSFSELATIGSQTLGFRGEALASANALSTIQVTTRTAQDAIASRFKLKPRVGGIEGVTWPVSAPVGTMVRATELFETMPVRKKQYLKDSRGMISRIKELVKMYVFARPYLKVTLRIKGEASPSLSYSPSSSPTIRDAGLQVFGVQLVANCLEAEAEVPREDERPREDNNITEVLAFDMLLPKRLRNTNPPEIKGIYVSVDSRPLSPSCSLSKSMAKTLKTILSHFIQDGSVSNNAAKSFMIVNIKCSPGSYDANVSPLKDELLFINEYGILKEFAAVCHDVYEEDDEGSESGQINTQRAIELVPGASTPKQRSPLCEISQDAPAREKSQPLRITLETSLAADGSKEDMGVDGPPLSHPPKASTETLVQATMRTRIQKVNMARQDSSNTDEEADLDLVEVMIPRSSPKFSGTEGRRQSRTRQMYSSLFSDDIGNYFKPLSEENFKVAQDETATTSREQEDCPEVAESLHPPMSRGAGRQPLLPLSDSDLNCRGSDPELDEAADGLTPSRTVLRSVSSQGDEITRGRGTVALLDSLLLSPPIRPITRGRDPEEALPSPPPSDLRRRVTARTLPFRQPEMLHSRQQLRPSSSLQTARFQTRPGRNSDVGNERRRGRSGDEVALGLDAMIIHASDGNKDSMSSPSFMGASRVGTSRREEELEQSFFPFPRVDFHTAQLRLMQTPRPPSPSAGESVAAQSLPEPEYTVRQERKHSLGTMDGVQRDPAKRQRLQSSSGRPGRKASLPGFQGHQGTTTTLRLNLGKVGTALEQMWTTEPEFNKGGAGDVLRFESLTGVIEVVEVRLQAVVAAWLEGIGQDLEVEYTMRSSIKVKGKVLDL